MEKSLLLEQRKTISFIFVQLGFFKKDKEECLSLMDQWLYCLKHMGSMGEFPASFCNADGLAELHNASEIAAFDETKKLTYIAEEMTEMDYRHDMYWSRKKGFEAGVKEVVLRMLKSDMPIPQIVKYSGLSEEQVLALSAEK